MICFNFIMLTFTLFIVIHDASYNLAMFLQNKQGFGNII